MVIARGLALMLIWAALSSTSCHAARFRKCAQHTGKLLDQNEELRAGASQFILNVGSNGDPPMPFDNNTLVIAVEPNTEIAARIPPTPGLYVIAAAVSDTWGLAAFHHYADSSSLLEPNVEVAITTEQVLQKGRQGAKLIVPTLPLSAILRSVAKLSCYFLKIDTQGMDFTIIRTAHRDIRRCQYVQAEVYCNGYEGYVGARNDYNTEWLPYMRSMGFEPLTQCHPKNPSETNILWRNTEAQDVEPLEVVQAKCRQCLS